MSELLLLSGDEPVLRCPLFGQVVSVGASPANDISLPGDDVPPLMCSFEPHDGGYRVVDRGGKGIKLRGNSAALHKLKDGDELPLGALTARFVAKAKKAPSKGAGQRTGILKTRGDKLCEIGLQLRLPDGSELNIPDDGLRIGAGESNDVIIDDGFVSSFHAHVFPKSGRLFVRDLDSTNGTRIGDMRVVEAELPLDATLVVGQTELTVVCSEREVHVEEVDSEDGPWQLGELFTADESFANVFQLIKKVAPHDATVCILGETGTGKELVASALHQLSARASGPFIALNCAAIPESLIEAELFGHEKGAFTGADQARAGAFEQAHKGTLFLDEVGELPLDVQAKLLRALEVRKVKRVGAHKELPVDVRIVAATHRDLVERVGAKEFRQDLLHRLWVIPVKLPPLRDRPLDITYLAKHFAKILSPGAARVLSSAAGRALLRHPYPGNVRELKNVIQRALIFSSGDAIDEEDIQFIPVSLADQAEMAGAYKRGMTLEQVERAAFQGALACYSSASEAARALGLPKSTFWRRARALGVLGQEEE